MKTVPRERLVLTPTGRNLLFIGMLALLSWAIVGLAAFIVWGALQ